MKKFILCFMALAIFSCSSDGDSNDSPSNNGTKLKMVTKFTSAGTIDQQATYTYNSEGNISSLTSISVYGETIANFSYDTTGKLTSFIEVTTDPFDDIRTEVNTMEYQGEWITQICQDITHNNTTSSFDDPEVDKIEFGYDVAGNVNLFTHYYSEDPESNTCDDVSSIANTEDLVYDANGNMTRYENSDYFFSPVYYTYSYDDQHHPYANVKPQSFRKLYGFSTNNNIISANEYNGDTDELEATINYNYTFNASGFPTVLERTYNATGGSPQTFRVEYTYY